MGTITPITQGIVYSAATQSAALTGTNNSPAPAPQASVTDTAAPTVSDKVISSSAIYSVSMDLAGLTSQLQVAQSSTEQIASILQSLQGIAQQLSEGTGDSSSLVSQFQSMYGQIEQIVAATSFDGSSLLAGSFSLDGSSVGLPSDGQQTSIVPNLSPQALFGGSMPDVTTPAGAEAALAQIANAQSTVNGASSSIDNVTNQLNFVMASVQTAQANNDAAGSTLTENELNNPGFTNFLSELLDEPDASAMAQTGNMPNTSLNSLLGEI